MGFWGAVGNALFGSGGQHDGSTQLDGHDGGCAIDLNGAVYQVGGGTIHYIEGKESPQSLHNAIVRVGDSGVLNGDDSAPVVVDEFYGCGTWTLEDYRSAQDVSSIHFGL